MAYLDINNVVKRYEGHTALAGVSMQVEQGCIYGLLGPNGAGKSTLIRIINRILAADEGTVTLNGKQMTDDDITHIGYLPEERGLYKKMKVGDHIVYLGRLKGMTKADAVASMHWWLDRFDLKEWENKKVEALSKGMQQKVQFIATVIHRPPLLIFDEPFSGFDPVNAEQLNYPAQPLPCGPHRQRGRGEAAAQEEHHCRAVARHHRAQRRPVHLVAPRSRQA